MGLYLPRGVQDERAGRDSDGVGSAGTECGIGGGVGGAAAR